MDDSMLYGYPESIWEIARAYLVGGLPVLLAALAGAVVGAVVLGKRGKPALLMTIAFLILFLAQIGFAFGHAALMHAIWNGEVLPERQRFLSMTLGYGLQGAQIVSLGLLAVAALGWRGRSAEVAAASGQAVQAGAWPVVGDVSLQPISKGLYITLIFGANLVAMLMLIPSYAILFSRDKDLVFVSLGLSCSSWVFSAVAVVMGCVLHYKLWATLQDGNVRTTPGKAVGFLFIPFFNLYWIFQSLYGWAVDFNRYIAERGIAAKRAPAGLVLTVCILGVIPYVNIVAWPLTFTFMWIHFSRAISGANAIRAMRARQVMAQVNG
ncbi:MAG: hypothetical protein KDA31_00940 [Phycisphaerales bacterium]|nr:hypothetical protein [Phycisphaerales bacterium]